MITVKYQINRKLLRLVVLILIPVGLTSAFFSYFTPREIELDYQTICEEGNCKKEFQQDRLVSLKTQFETKAEDLKILETLSNFPLASNLYWNFKLTNRAQFILSISNPLKSIFEPAEVACISPTGPTYVFPYGSGIIFNQASKSSEFENDLAMIAGFVMNNCVLNSQSVKFDTAKGFLVAPEGVVSASISEKYELKPIPTRRSVSIVFIILFIATLLGLPVFRQVWQFLEKGKSYFTQ